MKKLALVTLCTLVSLISVTAKAGLISVNGDSVEALDLNGSYSSFEEFYDLNTAHRFSSNTGLEVSDTAILFVAELNNELGIFNIFSDARGGSPGSVTLTLSGTSGNIVLFDDPSETVGGNVIPFKYYPNRTDGIIYGDLSDTAWSVDFTYSNAVNLNGLQVISFDGGAYDSASYSDLIDLDRTFTVQNIVSSTSVVHGPSIFMLFGGSLVLMLFARRK